MDGIDLLVTHGGMGTTQRVEPGGADAAAGILEDLTEDAQGSHT